MRRIIACMDERLIRGIANGRQEDRVEGSLLLFPLASLQVDWAVIAVDQYGNLHTLQVFVHLSLRRGEFREMATYLPVLGHSRCSEALDPWRARSGMCHCCFGFSRVTRMQSPLVRQSLGRNTH